MKNTEKRNNSKVSIFRLTKFESQYIIKTINTELRIGKENVMYNNLIKVMKVKGVTGVQIANLLDCRQATISDKLNGVVASGFTFDEAYKIKNVFFPEYDYEYLFIRENLSNKCSIT